MDKTLKSIFSLLSLWLLMTLVAVSQEAAESVDVAIRQYDVDLQIDYDNQRLQGNVTYHLEVLNDSTKIVFDGGSAIKPYQPKTDAAETSPLTSVMLDNKTVYPTSSEGQLVIEESLKKGTKPKLAIQFTYEAAFHQKYGETTGYKWKQLPVDGKTQTVAFYAPVEALAYDNEQFLFPGYYDGSTAKFRTRLRVPKRLCGIVTGDFVSCETVEKTWEVLEFESPVPVSIHQWAVVVGYFNVIETGKKNVTLIVPYNSPYNEKRDPNKSVFAQAKELIDSLEESVGIYSEVNSPYSELYLVLMTDGYPHAGLLTGNFAMLNNAILGSRWLKSSQTMLNSLDRNAAADAFKALQEEMQGKTPWKAILMSVLSNGQEDKAFDAYRERFLELYKEKKK